MLKISSGFTLIEIAIVLVIIGLLLGGILKGQTLINSAKVRNLAQQNASIQAAYFAFTDRYQAIPGDFPLIQAAAAIGETIQLPTASSTTAGNGKVDNTLEEAAAVWQHLVQAGFLSGSVRPATAVPGSETDYALHAPKNAFNGSMILSHNRGYTGHAVSRLNLHLGGNVPVAVARELDVKIDDGMPNTGLLRLSNSDGTNTAFDAQHFAPHYSDCTTAAGTTSANNAPGTNSASDIYDVFDKARDCQPVYLLY